MGSFLYNLFIYPVELLIDFIFSLILYMIGSPGFSLIALGLVVSVLVLPLYLRVDALQAREREKQKKMEKWVRHIRETFRGEERTMMLFACYRENDYHPLHALRGSFSLLLQIPFFMASYHYLSGLALLRGTAFHVIPNLGAPDGMLTVGGMTINLLPVLMTLFNLLSGALYTRGFPLRDKAQTYGIALLFLVLLYRSPAGLVLYWTTNNLFSLGKNLLLKYSKNVPRDAGLLAAAGGVFFFAYMALRGKLYTTEITVFSLLVLLACLLPLFLFLLRRKSDGRTASAPEENGKGYGRLYALSMLGLIVLLGALIPLSVLSASPEAFVLNSEGNRHPLLLILQSLIVAIGVFGVWGSILYGLASPLWKRRLAKGASGLLLLCILDHFFFYRDIGIVYDSFKPESVWVEAPDRRLNLLAVLVLFAVLAFLWLRKKGKALRPFTIVSLLALLSLSIMSAQQCVVTEMALRTTPHTPYNTAADMQPPAKALVFSRTEKNVLVLMLDRAISAFVPYILAEDPGLTERFSGFVYYPNTVSYGGFTIFGALPLMGGYEYTPLELNKRKDVPLVDKYREAITLLPALFSGADYRVVVADPPDADYHRWNDWSVFNAYPNTEVLTMYGRAGQQFPGFYDVAEDMIRQQRKHNMFFYALMRCVPNVATRWLYHDGNYWSVHLESIQEEALYECYAALSSLPEMTVVEEDGQGLFFFMDNELTHTGCLLQLPDYTLSNHIDNSPYEEAWASMFPEEWVLDSDLQKGSYHDNAAALRLLADWFDELRRLGVYDNTRIIVVSDHGYHLHSIPELMMSDELDAERFNAVLMVKDFGAEGFAVDDQFMTVADVPSLAAEEVLTDPVNPATNNPVNREAKKDPQAVTTSFNFLAYNQNPTTLDTQDGAWYLVHDDLFLPENWERLEKEPLE